MDFLRAACVFLLVVLLGMSLSGCLDDGDEGGDDSGPDNGGGGDGNARQTERGSISGLVEGLEGPLEGARVDISNVFDSTTTDSAGRFQFDDLAQAQYRLTFTEEFHRRTTKTVLLEAGGEEEITVELDPLMLTANVPAKYGIQTRPISSQDTLIFSVGLPGMTQASMTNETMDSTFPGFWEIEPEPGYRIAHFTVVLGWIELPELGAGLGLQYFRGESPVANEITEGETTEYHTPDAYLDGPGFAYYLLENDDWEKWGDRNWQLGVYSKDEEGPAPAGAAVEHVIQVVVTMVAEEYAQTV